MDNAITEQCTKLNLTLDFELLTTEFEKDPDGAADNHVIETLFTILDFHKFKELMLAYKQHDEQENNGNKTNVNENISHNTDDDIGSQLEQMVEDGKILLESGDKDIWKLHTKIADKQRTCYQSKDLSVLQTKLKIFKLKNSIWKFDVIMKDMDYNKIVRF